MPAREAPTARQQRLGIELRKLRERAGFSATEAGAALGLGGSRVSNIEVGRIGVSAERVRAMARAYKCGDQSLVDALADMTSARGRRWWDDYRETLPSMLLDIAELEHCASAIRTAQVSIIPGLLQTVEYARLVFRQNIPELGPPDIEHLVSHRIKRQGVLYGDSPTPYTAVIHEAALRMRFGCVGTTREQLQFLLDMSERDHVTLLVIPFTAGLLPGAGQTVLFVEGPVPQLDTVQLDSEHGSEFVHADAHLEMYRAFMKRFEEAALDVATSREVIGKILESV